MKTKFLKIASLIFGVALIFTLLTACNKNEQFEGISLTDVTVSYNQSGHNVIVNGLENYPDATYILSEEKIDVGVYTQTITVSQEGYEDFTASATLTIKKVTPENLYPQTTSNSFYNNGVLRAEWTGSPMVVTAFTNYEQKSIAVIEYYQGETKLNGAPTEVGDYKVKISLPETQNYYALSKEFTLQIIQPQYVATFKLLNPITNEIEEESVGVKAYQRQVEIDVPFNVNDKYNGYVFLGWFVNDELINETYTYDKDITVIGKFVRE